MTVQRVGGTGDSPVVRALRRRRSLAAGLVQLLYVCGGLALGLLVPTLDVGAPIATGEAVAVLAGVIGGLIAMTGIVLALLFLVVQFAATSQSPRLHLFRDHPLVWHALGLMVGVLVYAATAAVIAGTNAIITNRTTTTVLVPVCALLLVLAALAVTRQLQMQALRSVQLAPVLDQITRRCRAVIDRLYTAPFPQPERRRPAPPQRVLQVRWPGRQTIVRQIDLPGLLGVARRADTVIRLRVMPGDLVREDAVVLEIWDPAEDPDPSTVLRHLEVGIDRNLAQDPLLGFRLLNDIALRATSTAINDPATAVQALDCIESLLTTLVRRDLADGVIADDTGSTRVILEVPSWETFLAAGADEVMNQPVHPMVAKRVMAMLEMILAVAPAERREPVARRIAALQTGTPPTEV